VEINIPPPRSAIAGSGMTGFAKGNKIILIVRTAVINRTDMVYLVYWNIPSGFKTMLTQGMFGNI